MQTITRSAPPACWRPSLAAHRFLTKRQRQVLDLLATNRTNREIGELLGISLDGAKWHVGEILGSLNAGSRQEVGRWWREQRRSGDGQGPLL